MGCGCKQPVVRNPKPTRLSLALTPEQIEEIEKNNTIEPITLTDEQITEYLNSKNGESEESTGTDSE